ncbi:MAG: ribonuclease J, partial [Deltaproteobacteria bacterium]|nr:ribonuclease J [Deltaproteobacteria bacterium]
MNEPFVDLIFLGGLGEIGLNSMALKCGQDLVVIDAGLMFPDQHMYGVDVVIPDFSYVLEHAEKVRAIILTHGHEDHIGALPFLLNQINVPIYGTRFTLELVKDRLKEHRLLPNIPLTVISPREKLEVGPFTFEFIKVSHSIIDGVALAIMTPAGCLVHSGDFKIEQSPVAGEEIDLNKFAEYGEKGVLALLSDSTNVERAGYTMSEKKIGDTFREIFQSCQGRIIVALFASSITRIQQVISIAADFDRKIAFDGRSMITNVRIARELGIINMDTDQEITLKEIADFPDEKVVLITTGSQGEPMSALTRMAANDHKQISIKQGDTVILSSRFIPGNERAITNIINNLYRLGAEVIYETVSEIHVSGHAYQEELKLMINLVRPKYFVPIHGEYRHLIKHNELAREVGLPEENLVHAEDGDLIRFDQSGFRKIGRVPTGRVLVDGKGVGDVGQAVLRDRRHLAEHGMVIPLIVIDDRTCEILSGPDFISKGFIFEEASPHVLEDAKCLILEIFDRLAEERNASAGLFYDLDEIKVEIRRELKRF